MELQLKGTIEILPGKQIMITCLTKQVEKAKETFSKILDAVENPEPDTPEPVVEKSPKKDKKERKPYQEDYKNDKKTRILLM